MGLQNLYNLVRAKLTFLHNTQFKFTILLNCPVFGEAYKLSFAVIELGSSRKPSRISLRLDKINTIVDWDTIYDLVKDIDYTNTDIGGRPPLALLSKTKMLFLQHLHNLSDPGLEDQVNDR